MTARCVECWSAALGSRDQNQPRRQNSSVSQQKPAPILKSSLLHRRKKPAPLKNELRAASQEPGAHTRREKKDSLFPEKEKRNLRAIRSGRLSTSSGACKEREKREEG